MTDQNPLPDEVREARLHRQSRIVSIAAIVLIPAICLLTHYDLIVALWTWILHGDGWTQSGIERMIGVALPADATNIQFDGTDSGNYTYLNLTFNASTKSADDFANHLCAGGLHPHYDPFNAIDVEQSVTYRYAVKFKSLYPYPAYFSYSPITPNYVRGTRCFNEWQFLTVIRLDRSSDRTEAVRIRFSEASTLRDARAFHDFPMLVRGFIKFTSYNVVNPTICFEIDPLAFMRPKNPWMFLKNSTAQVSINGERFQDARITDDGFLKPIESNDKVEANQYFSYCVVRTWDKKLNTVDVAITSQDGMVRHYPWQFEG